MSSIKINTPSSEIIHLVSTFADTLDSIPPTLTRSLSDLKELDAVLSGSLQAITTKLQLLLAMMHSPSPSADNKAAHTFTPFERLKLLREVTEDARVFRLGGEDKIRVATGTCESIATHTAHLSTLSTLLLTYLPSHLLPMLPPPSAPHGYPSSVTPSSALARRQLFDYPPALNHVGEGGTTRLQGALGMVRQHWDMTRGRGTPNAKGPNPSGRKRHDVYGAGAASASIDSSSHRDKEIRQPNQYSKKKTTLTNHSLPNFGGHPGGSNAHRYPSNGMSQQQHQQQQHHHLQLQQLQQQHQNQAGYSGQNHPLGGTGVEAVKEKRRGPMAQHGGHQSSSQHQQSNSSSFLTTNLPESVPLSASSSRMGGMYLSNAEYEAATSGTSGPRGGKRKGEADLGATKRRKKGLESPEITPRATPAPLPLKGNSRRAPAKTQETASHLTSHHQNLALPPLQSNIGNVGPVVPGEMGFAEQGDLIEGEEGGEDDGDGQIYCYCHRVSFGEMIGCDGSECEREWFHLACVGLNQIPKGRWFCTECRTIATDKSKKRR